jgi:hypothetical protein
MFANFVQPIIFTTYMMSSLSVCSTNQWIPIPIISTTCEKHCCAMTFLPLTLAYGKTAHTFQGQTAGPGHPIEVIIVQPGTQSFEGQCPGLFYVLLSRATTIGVKKDHSDSAIFFFTNDMTFDQIWDLCKNKKTGHFYKTVQNQNKWIEHLKQNTKQRNFKPHETDALLKWATNTKV